MKKIRYEFQRIYYNLDKILLLFFTLFTIMEFVWIPLNSWISEVLLAMTGYDYLSPTNLWSVLLGNGFVAILFLLLFLLNVAIAYLELALLFTGVWYLLDENTKHLLDYMRNIRDHMVAIVQRSSLPKFIFLLLYSVLLLPFLRRILNIYYFNKIVIPQFILEYFSNTTWLAIFIFFCFLFFFWLSSRLMYALPYIYFEHKSVRASIAYSWNMTRGREQLRSFFRLFWLVTFPILLFSGIGFLLYGWQRLLDEYLPNVAHTSALFSYVLLKFSFYGVIALFMMNFVSLLTGKEMSVYRQRNLRHRLRFAILLLSSFTFAFQGWIALTFPFDTMPVAISHRGVDDRNAVQNSIDALEKISKLKPDYVEMDIQETKDGQFVVMHDTDLMLLTGHSGGTHDYTLTELTSMTVSENGMTAQIPSFDDYLEKADSLGQKLLVEIKATSADSPNLSQQFVKKYGKRLILKGHQVQSLDYNIIVDIKNYDERLVSFFILPFNSIYPRTPADGYTMEYTSLDKNFMLKSWFRDKLVYAWTPNDEDSMMRMVLLQVDGIITDNMTELQSLIREMQDNRQYAYLFLLQFQSLLYHFE